ncbi:heterokaryon incompatibility protein-domain-containing protein [Xylariomycetidae sp. FL2044]|nr:heterokaryon incompatibility protein-domain-containing protein [Xylariomycetidae sp. FL2044]
MRYDQDQVTRLGAGNLPNLRKTDGCLMASSRLQLHPLVFPASVLLRSRIILSVTTESVLAMNLDLREYVYQPLEALDAIRLLVLEPANIASAPLRGSIIQIRRMEELIRSHNRRSYSAVSYTWGDQTPCERLLITESADSGGESFISITPHVRDMLEHLRNKYESTNLWIDAICLDQKDDEEKVQQIPLIGEIFSHASRVHIWFGSEQQDAAARVFAFIRLVTLSPEPRDLSSFATTVFGDSVTAQSHIKDFFRHPWFSRRWILQEAAFAVDALVHTGEFTIPFQLLSRACLHMAATPWAPPAYALDVVSTIDGDLEKDLFDLLWKLDESICRDRRDRILALYSFIPVDQRFSFAPGSDYIQVYKKHAIALVNLHRGYQVFYRHLVHFGAVAGHRSDDCSIPSWIPDWSNTKRNFFRPYCESFLEPDFWRVWGEMNWDKWQEWRSTHQRELSGSLEYSSLREASLWHGFLQCSPILDVTEGIGLSNLTACKDEVGRDVLNAKWGGAWPGPYGRNVVQMVASNERPRTWHDVVQNFLPLKREATTGTERKSNLERLARNILMLMMLMAEDKCFPMRYLDHLDERGLFLVIFQAMELAMMSKSISQPERILHPFEGCDIMRHILSAPVKAPVTLQGFLLDLGMLQYESGWAILELGNVDIENSMGRERPVNNGVDYAIGPSTLQIGTLVIPVLRGRSTLIGQEKLTLIALHPVDKQPVSTQIVVAPGPGDEITLAPLEARYIGPCCSCIGDRPNFLTPRTEGEWADFYKRWISFAKERGDPAPFTIDII